MKQQTRKCLCVFCLLFMGSSCFSQCDSSASPLKITGYADIYYCYDFSKPENHTRPHFVYSYNRHNEVNVNLAYGQLSFSKNGVRSTLALMAGTYAQYNLAHEPPIFQHVMEASAGVKISKKHNAWIDAGIMPSHLGAESPVGKNCWNLTRSIGADNSPYYETGVRISYADKPEKWYLSVYVLNGWQRIQRQPYNQTPAFGTQLTYKANTKLTLNWSTFVGNEFPDTAQRWRYFNDFYAIIHLGDKFSILPGFDIGLQQKNKHAKEYDIWYVPLLIARYKLNEKMCLAARAEYYGDKNQVIISTGTPNGFQTSGFSMNFDLNIRPHFVWRNEGRMFLSKDAIFTENGNTTNHNYFLTTSFCIAF